MFAFVAVHEKRVIARVEDLRKCLCDELWIVFKEGLFG
jgi:hypothetical protein